MSEPTDEQYATIGKIAACWAAIDSSLVHLKLLGFQSSGDRVWFEIGHKAFRDRYAGHMKALVTAFNEGRVAAEAADAVEALRAAEKDALLGRNAVIHGLYLTPENPDEGEPGWGNPGTGVAIPERDLEALLRLSRYTRNAAIRLSLIVYGGQPDALGERPAAPRLAFGSKKSP